MVGDGQASTSISNSISSTFSVYCKKPNPGQSQLLSSPQTTPTSHLYDPPGPLLSNGKPKVSISDKSSNAELQTFKALPSIPDFMALLKTSPTFSQAAIVAFFSSLADVGLHASLLYYLKARFHFNKDQFIDLMVISGVAGTISQLVLMPLLAPVLGEERRIE